MVSLKIAEAILFEEYDVCTTVSDKTFFGLLDKLIPDLILLDIEMPDIDGYSIIEKLKADEKTAHIPVIFLTGISGSGSEIKGLEFGAADYITKPYLPDILKARIRINLLLERQKKELRECVRKAEIASKAKSEFIAMMSHEMRTPLTAIIGFAELSLEALTQDEDFYSNLSNIKKAGTTLLSIINDILDISKIESGKFELDPVKYNTANLISDALAQSILHRNGKSIAFNLKVSENFPAKLFGDERRAKQILVNLLSNAFKYTEEGEVELSLDCTIEDDAVLVKASIRDTGIGVRPENLESIFDDYERIDTAANSKTMGTGLGLPVSRRLAEMMGGSINAESEYGKGSTLTVSIRQQLISGGTIPSETVDALRNLRYTEQEHSTENLPQIHLPNARILVVDDIDTNLKVAAGMLKHYSIKADCVTNGPEAIEAIRNENVRYDAILMDHMMPNMDGIQAAKRIREIGSDYAKNIPIIAFTANAIAGREEMFLESGFQAFISKPIEPATLDAVIKKWVQGESKEAGEPPERVVLSQVPPAFRIDGINFKKGLERFGGNVNIYLDVLRTFAKSTSSILEKASVISNGNLEEYTTAVHGIKGACYGICADKTASLAEALEIAAKEENYDYIIANNPAFIGNTQELLANINTAITEAQANNKKTHKSQPDSQLLEKLLDSCKRHDMNEIDAIISQLNSHIYDAGGELITWLSEMADEMNYAEMLQELSENNKKLGVKNHE